MVCWRLTSGRREKSCWYKSQRPANAATTDSKDTIWDMGRCPWFIGTGWRGSFSSPAGGACQTAREGADIGWTEGTSKVPTVSCWPQLTSGLISPDPTRANWSCLWCGSYMFFSSVGQRRVHSWWSSGVPCDQCCLETLQPQPYHFMFTYFITPSMYRLYSQCDATHPCILPVLTQNISLFLSPVLTQPSLPLWKLFIPQKNELPLPNSIHLHKLPYTLTDSSVICCLQI